MTGTSPRPAPRSCSANSASPAGSVMISAGRQSLMIAPIRSTALARPLSGGVGTAICPASRQPR